MSFFKNFPIIPYDLFEQGDIKSITNVFKHVDVKEIGIDPFLSYTYYDIEEADRPDNVSRKLYGSTDFYWTLFILNDELKNGLSAWPKTNQALDRYLTQEFDKTSVLQFIPQPESIKFTTASENTYNYEFYSNIFQGLNMSHPYLRLKRANNNSHAYARISHYDADLFHLHIYNVNDPDKFYLNEGQFLASYVVEEFNPHNPQEDQYNVVENLNEEWRKSVIEYMKANDPGYHDVINGVVLQFYGIDELNSLYTKRYLELWRTIRARYTATGIYREGRNAPAEYITQSGESISAFDALVGELLPTSEEVYLDNVKIQFGSDAGEDFGPFNGNYVYNSTEKAYIKYQTGTNVILNLIKWETDRWKFYYNYGQGSQHVYELSTSVSEEQGFWSTSGQSLWANNAGTAGQGHRALNGETYGGANWTRTVETTRTGTADYPYFNTVAERERAKNLAKRQIRVVKPSVINSFVDAYKNLIES
jgi:hypothetical protein